MPRPNTMRIIALTGHKQSGKDSVADVLEEQGFERIAFADPLKAIAAEIGWNGTKDDCGACEHCGMLQGRQLIQVLGTEGLRSHLWRRILIDTLLRRIESRKGYVITDLRFPDEASAVRSWGGNIWRVRRPGFEGDGHLSESHINDITPDIVLVNDGSMEDLRIRASEALTVPMAYVS